MIISTIPQTEEIALLPRVTRNSLFPRADIFELTLCDIPICALARKAKLPNRVIPAIVRSMRYHIWGFAQREFSRLELDF